MSLLNPQQFTVEGFADQQSWIGKLFGPLNQFTGDVVRAFRNQITIKDNLFQEIKEIKFVNSSEYFPIRFTTKFNTAPLGLVHLYVFNNTGSTYSVLPPHLVWKYADGQVIISEVVGLTASETYTIRILVIYG